MDPSLLIRCLCILAGNCGPRAAFCPDDARALCLDGNLTRQEPRPATLRLSGKKKKPESFFQPGRAAAGIPASRLAHLLDERRGVRFSEAGGRNGAGGAGGADGRGPPETRGGEEGGGGGLHCESRRRPQEDDGVQPDRRDARTSSRLGAGARRRRRRSGQQAGRVVQRRGGSGGTRPFDHHPATRATRPSASCAEGDAGTDPTSPPPDDGNTAAADGGEGGASAQPLLQGRGGGVRNAGAGVGGQLAFTSPPSYYRKKRRADAPTQGESDVVLERNVMTNASDERTSDCSSVATLLSLKPHAPTSLRG